MKLLIENFMKIFSEKNGLKFSGTMLQSGKYPDAGLMKGDTEASFHSKLNTIEMKLMPA